MLQGYFRSSCPPELEEAALIDGCNYFTAFTKVMVPVSMPGIVAVSIFTFLGAWNDFLWASMILNQGQMKTLQIGLRDFMSESGNLTADQFVHGGLRDRHHPGPAAVPLLAGRYGQRPVGGIDEGLVSNRLSTPALLVCLSLISAACAQANLSRF